MSAQEALTTLRLLYNSRGFDDVAKWRGLGWSCSGVACGIRIFFLISDISDSAHEKGPLC